MSDPMRNTGECLGYTQTPLEDLQKVLIDHYERQVPYLQEVEKNIKVIYDRVLLERQNAESNLSALKGK